MSLSCSVPGTVRVLLNFSFLFMKIVAVKIISNLKNKMFAFY